MPTVSVIIPTYGHAEFILETLDSVFHQTFRDFEVLVVNDGSPDHTAEVLAPLARSGKIRYFEQRNQGVAAARNFGISQANGIYIALLDDDDMWPSDKLEWQVKCLAESSAIAVGGSVDLLHGDGMRQSLSKPRNVNLSIEDIFTGNPFHSPGQVMFRRSAFEEGARFDPAIWGADDIDFWVELAYRGAFERHARLALIYRLHGSNASKKTFLMFLNCEKFLEKRLKQLTAAELLTCRGMGYRWLFNYLGRQLVWDARFALVSRTPRLIYGTRLLFYLFMAFRRSRAGAKDSYKALKREIWRAFVVDIAKRLAGRL